MINEVDEQQEYRPQPIIPTPFATYGFIAVFVLVFIFQVVTDTKDSQIAAFGFDKIRFNANHEYWRILTSAFMHGGIVHLGFNSYAFYIFGRTAEVISNRVHIVCVFLISALVGNLFSLEFLPNGLSIGASGGVLGLVGFLAIYGWKRRQFLAPDFLRTILINVAITAFYGIAINTRVDNWAHLGGFLGGALYGLLRVPGDPHKDPREVNTTERVVGFICTFICVVTVTALVASMAMR